MFGVFELKIAFDIARGMNILFLKSGMKIIHRNIKPENIFIFSMDEHSTNEINSIHAKLGDLGRCVIGIPFYFQSLDNDFRYTAPEALKGSSIVPYSQSIDVYSFGILLWQLLSRKIPFYDLENESNVAELIISGYRPTIGDLPSDIPEEIIRMIISCWNSNPKRRIGFEKIISIISLYFKGDFKHSTKNLKNKRIIIGKNNVRFFSNFQFLGSNDYGLIFLESGRKSSISTSLSDEIIEMDENVMQAGSDSAIEDSEDSKTICINNRNICILNDENGTRIFDTNDVKLNVEELMKKTRKYLGNQQKWKLTQIRDIYNGLIESSELIQMIQYILSSSALTLNILNHPKEDIELNNRVSQVLHLLERFMSLVHFISKYHKDKNDFLSKWKNIFDIITILTSFKDIDHHTSTTHICVDLYPRTEEDNYIQENQNFGLIVFVDSNSNFLFKANEKCIGLGITNTNSWSLDDPHSSIPINIFGSSLVQVVYPTRNDCVDERGMFVILNKNQRKNVGIGEIISFGDLITRESSSYHLVGICPLDKTEQANPSLFLFSTPSHTSRITHSLNHIRICFVCMISLPMSDSLAHLLLHRTSLPEKNKKLLPNFLLL